MNTQIKKDLPSPTGWLVNTEKKWVIFFIKDQKSLMKMPNVITQLWYSTKEGIPMRLKNTRKMDLESALETWNELLSNGWELVEHQINKEIAYQNNLS